MAHAGARDEANRFPNATGYVTLHDAEALLAAAPHATLHACLRCPPQEAAPALQAAAPFDRLRLRRLALTDNVSSVTTGMISMLQMAAGLGVGTPFPPTAVAPCIAPLAAALRAHRSLPWLECAAAATRDPPQALATLLGSLAGHPTLRVLLLSLADASDALLARGGGGDAALRALCALVEADAPALKQLHVLGATLGDAELAPLCGALAHNTHLRVLDCGANSACSEALAAQTLLPAARAATALRELRVKPSKQGAPAPAMDELQALLRARKAED